MSKFLNQLWSGQLKCLRYVALLILSLEPIAHAQNKVVVIPLEGDRVIVEVPGEEVIVEVPTTLTPTTPLANVDTDQSDYTISALTAIDNITRLEWQRMDDGVSRTWDDAWDYCVNLNIDIQSDWRLPTVTELLSIVDYGRASAPLIDPVAFINPTSNLYWSASNFAGSSTRAWGVQEGFTGDLNKTTLRRVRCVR